MELKQITAEEFTKFSRLINDSAGIFLKDNKMGMLNNRLRPRLKEKAFGSFSEYYEYILDKRNSREMEMVLNLIATNETFFFRNSSHFEALEMEILPYLFKKRKRPLRILSAGCSTGEEPVTLALILEERGWQAKYPVKIDAVDISTLVLEQAGSGLFKEKSFRNMPAYYKTKYFSKIDDDYYQLDRRINSTINYERFNLKSDLFYGRYDLILCRNVMIYFDKENQESLIDKFYETLNSDSYLIIGHSESLYFLNNKFKYSKVIEAPVYYKE